MTPVNFQKLQIGFLALLAGVSITPLVGFDGGYWVTKKTAVRMAQDAAMPVRTALCTTQFTSGGNYQDKLKEFKALDSTGKTAYIEKNGIGKMPGEEKVSSDVMQACGTALEKL